MTDRVPFRIQPCKELPPIDEIQTSPDKLKTMEDIGENAYRLLAALGIPLDHPFLEAVREFDELSKQQLREKRQQPSPKT